MKSTTIAKGIVKAVAFFLFLALLIFILFKIQSVIAYCAIAAVIALIGRPMVILLRRKLKFNSTIAVVLTLMLVLALFVGIFALFVPVISDQSDNFALLNLENLQGKIDELIITISKQIGTSQAVVEDIIEEVDIENSVVEGLEVGFIPTFLNAILEIISNLGIGLFSVLFISFFFMKDSQLIQKVIVTVVPKDQEMKTLHAISDTKNLLSRYFLGLLIQMSILFVFYTGGLFIAGIENAVIIALICALFNIVPYIGPMIGGAIMLLLTMTSNIEMDFNTVVLPNAMYVLIGFGIGQLIDNFISQPIIFSNSVKSHPLEIFLVIIVFGLLFGVVGMIVAVPGYTVLKVVMKKFGADNKVINALTRDM